MNVYLFVLTDGPLEPQHIFAASQLLEKIGIDMMEKQDAARTEDRLSSSDSADDVSAQAISTDTGAIDYLERCLNSSN